VLRRGRIRGGPEDARSMSVMVAPGETRQLLEGVNEGGRDWRMKGYSGCRWTSRHGCRQVARHVRSSTELGIVYSKKKRKKITSSSQLCLAEDVSTTTSVVSGVWARLSGFLDRLPSCSRLRSDFVGDSLELGLGDGGARLGGGNVAGALGNGSSLVFVKRLGITSSYGA